MTGRTVVVDSALLSVRARFPIRSAVSTAVQISFEPELFFGHIFVLTECGRVRLCADSLRAICRGAIIFGGTLLPNGTFCTVSAATVEASLSAVFDAVLAASTFVPDAQPGLAVRVCKAFFLHGTLFALPSSAVSICLRAINFIVFARGTDSGATFRFGTDS